MVDETNEEECIHLIFPVSACTICTPPKPDPFEGLTGVTYKVKASPIQAEFTGVCGLCSGQIIPGDWIVMIDKMWCHSEPCGREYNA